MEQFDTLPSQVDILNICMKEFGKNDGMTAMKTKPIYPFTNVYSFCLCIDTQIGHSRSCQLLPQFC